MEGRFLKNRGWLGRKLILRPTTLSRAIWTARSRRQKASPRARVLMPFNFDNGLINGGVATSGHMFGGKNGMALTADSLKLTHIPELIHH
jgi:hypothetical protein